MKNARVRWCTKCINVCVTAMVLLCLGNATAHVAIRQGNESKIALLQKVLEGLERVTDFLKSDYGSINVDGLFGIRLCQGSIDETLKDCAEKVWCPTDINQRIEELSHSLGVLADKALPYVEAQDPEYFKNFIKTIDSEYIVTYTPRRVGESKIETGTSITYDETEGDRCLSLLMGTFTDKGRTFPECTLTKECWELMTKPNTAAYSITHQLLYFIIGEKEGCLEKLNDQVKLINATSVRAVEEKMCRSIYSEMKVEAMDGVPLMEQDLFLEQTVLCGILGFQDFFPEKWINMVLSWQTPLGCFALPENMMMIEAKLSAVQGEQRELMHLLVDEAEKIDGNAWSGRKLLREKVMDGDCLAHKTGLGVGVLGTYVRYLVREAYQ